MRPAIIAQLLRRQTRRLERLEMTTHNTLAIHEAQLKIHMDEIQSLERHVVTSMALMRQVMQETKPTAEHLQLMKKMVEAHDARLSRLEHKPQQK